jgi:hypothetical protein
MRHNLFYHLLLILNCWLLCRTSEHWRSSDGIQCCAKECLTVGNRQCLIQWPRDWLVWDQWHLSHLDMWKEMLSIPSTVFLICCHSLRQSVATLTSKRKRLPRTQLQNCDNALFVRRHDLNGDKAQAASIWEYLSTESAIWFLDFCNFSPSSGIDTDTCFGSTFAGTHWNCPS